MSTTAPPANPQELQNFSQALQNLINPFHKQFRTVIRTYVAFNLGFIVLGFVELTLLIICFSAIEIGSLLAVSLGIAFLTIFTYLILRVYLQTKKPEQFASLKEQYLNQAKQLLAYEEGVLEHHMGIASAMS